MGVHTVQFVGKDQTLHAFDKWDTVNWSFWQGTQMLFAYEGDNATESRNELEDWIQIMSKGTNAIYTLKFYKNRQEIKPATKEDGSFNFRLYIESMQNSGAPGTVGSVFGESETIRLLREDIAEIKKQFLLHKKEDPEKLETWEKILDHPVTMAAIGKFLGLDVKGFEEATAKLNGVPGYSIKESITILEQSDSKLEEHLYKLAVISQKKPANFKTLMGMLDQMIV